MASRLRRLKIHLLVDETIESRADPTKKRRPARQQKSSMAAPLPSVGLQLVRDDDHHGDDGDALVVFRGDVGGRRVSHAVGARVRQRFRQEVQQRPCTAGADGGLYKSVGTPATGRKGGLFVLHFCLRSLARLC